MTIFVVFRVQDPVRMKNAVETVFAHDHFSLGHDEWLISAKGTAKEISDRLGITDLPVGNVTKAGSAIIFSMENYYGRAANDIWEWIKTKMEATNG